MNLLLGYLCFNTFFSELLFCKAASSIRTASFKPTIDDDTG